MNLHEWFGFTPKQPKREPQAGEVWENADGDPWGRIVEVLEVKRGWVRYRFCGAGILYPEQGPKYSRDLDSFCRLYCPTEQP